MKTIYSQFIQHKVTLMDDTEEYAELFNRLQSFYILITIHDVQDYEAAHLKGLAHRLEGQLALSQEQQEIHNELTEKSDRNVADKKRKKKERKQASQEGPPGLSFDKEKEQSTIDVLADMDSNINESMCLLDIQKWEVTNTVQGIIYDGKLFIKMKTELEGSKNRQVVGFYVCSDQKESTVTKKTLDLLGLPKKEKNPWVFLLVQTKRHRFTVAQQGYNILGLDFLRDHNVLLNCNYRPDCFNFQLQFTA